MITGIYAIKDGRAPHGARGLKYSIINAITAISKSRPARGAWIEIVVRIPKAHGFRVAPRTGRVD